MIEIIKSDNNNFTVKIKKNLISEHKVFFSDNFYSKFKGNRTKEMIIKKSFEFLLERESNESILRSFDLEEIENYFPEYNKILNITLKHEK